VKEKPHEFPIKVFGLASEQFEAAVLKIIRKHYPEIVDHAISKRPSSDGKYLAFTVVVHVENQDQLDKIYYDLTACPLVTIAL
jgi:putative lipoic acid-binding regulatory protein